MGFHVSTLHNLPVGAIRYFVHVIDMSGGLHARWIEENLAALGAALGSEVGLVTGPQNLTEELYKFLKNNVGPEFQAVERLLRSATCLIVSEGHLTSTQRPVYLLPLALPDAKDSALEVMETLIRMLGDAMHNGVVDQLVKNFGAMSVGLSPAGGGLIVCTLRKLNEVLELKPNWIGIGLNLNSAIEKCLPPAVRKL